MEKQFMLEQLEKTRAEKEKYKIAIDKLCKSEAEMKRQLRKMKIRNIYKNISDEEVVERLVTAISEGNHEAIAAIIDNEIKMAVDSLITLVKVFKS